jgi:hypothetical protein
MSQRSTASSFATRLVCVATAVGLVAGGCTQTRVEMVAKYQPGEPSRVDRAPEVGVYKIKYAAGPAGETLHTLHGSKRFLGKGQPVGFEAGEDGAVIAVAGEERFTAKLPAGARFCVWYTKNEEPSDFARGAGDVAHHLGVAAVIGVVGGVVVLGALDKLDGDDCRHGRDGDRCRKCRH